MKTSTTLTVAVSCYVMEVTEYKQPYAEKGHIGVKKQINIPNTRKIKPKIQESKIYPEKQKIERHLAIKHSATDNK